MTGMETFDRLAGRRIANDQANSAATHRVQSADRVVWVTCTQHGSRLAMPIKS